MCTKNTGQAGAAAAKHWWGPGDWGRRCGRDLCLPLLLLPHVLYSDLTQCPGAASPNALAVGEQLLQNHAWLICLQHLRVERKCYVSSSAVLYVTYASPLVTEPKEGQRVVRPPCRGQPTGTQCRRRPWSGSDLPSKNDHENILSASTASVRILTLRLPHTACTSKRPLQERSAGPAPFCRHPSGTDSVRRAWQVPHLHTWERSPPTIVLY